MSEKRSIQAIQQTPDEAIEQILRLREAEQQAGLELSESLAATREFLERVVGPTVRPATAARLLRISHPALHRWLEKDEISSVATAEGRREIPLQELLDLLEEVEAVRREVGEGRPLARVMARRRRDANESVDLDRLIPRRQRSHRSADANSLAYHRLVAEKLEPTIIKKARRRLDRWIREERIHPTWAAEWNRILSLPLPAIAKTISADTVRGRELRQTSPFAGTLNEHERRRLNQAVQQRFG